MDADSSRPAPPRPFDMVSLRARVVSALVLAPLVVVCVIVGGPLYVVAVVGAMALALREWLRMVYPAAPLRLLMLAHGGMLAALAVGAALSTALGAMAGLVAMLALFLVAARDNMDRAGWVAAGLPYIGGSGLALIEIRTALAPDAGLGMTLFLMAVVWATDIGAFAVGRLVGGAKLLPEVSPNKTWSGFLGGMALAAAADYAAAAGFGAAVPWVGCALGVGLAAVAQLGDLFESYVKRRSGVKDSSGIIPGHGGILDRIDGLLFAAVFLVLFHMTAGAALRWW